MPIPDTLISWVVWFYDTFILPLINICRNTDVLGFSLFEWVMGFTVTTIAIHFLRDLFGAENSEKG